MGHVSSIVGVTNAYKIQHKVQNKHKNSWVIWEDNNKMNLKELYYVTWLDTSGSVRRPLVGSCKTGNDNPG